MATRNIVPRADNEGGIGTTAKVWLKGFFKTIRLVTGAAASTILTGDANGDASWGLTYDTDGALTSNSDVKVATQKATKTYADLKLAKASNLSDVANAATAFGNIKQSATTSATGVVELATQAEVLAGTDTSRAVVPVDLAAAQAVVSNPKAMAQGVHLTASSTVGSLTVADDDDIDFGTGNCFFQADVALPDFTPSATVYLFYKSQDATHRVLFYVSTAGYLVLDLNGTAYTSSATLASVGVTDGYKAKLRADVTVGSVNTLVGFSVNGLALGTQQTAANPGSLTNTGTLYLMGTSTTRHACTAYAFYTGNRAFTAAEIKSMAVNGIAYADKWGSQTEFITDSNNRDFGDGDINDWIVNTDGNGTCVYDAGPGAEKTAKVRVGATAGTYTGGILDTSKLTALTPYKKYRITMSIYLPAGHSWTSVSPYFAAMGIDFGTSANMALTNQWQTVSHEVTTNTDIAGYVGARGVSTTTGDYFYFDNISVKKLSVTLALESEGIQPAPGQCLDSSSNKLHAWQPATGSSFTRYKNTFEIRGINTWAASHEAQSVTMATDASRAMLPANCYIDEIIGVVAGTTIEDIIVGDGSDTDHWVAATTGLAAGTTSFTIANHISDGTNMEMVVDPDANFTGTITWTIRGHILD